MGCCASRGEARSTAPSPPKQEVHVSNKSPSPPSLSAPGSLFAPNVSDLTSPVIRDDTLERDRTVELFYKLQAELAVTAPSMESAIVNVRAEGGALSPGITTDSRSLVRLESTASLSRLSSTAPPSGLLSGLAIPEQEPLSQRVDTLPGLKVLHDTLRSQSRDDFEAALEAAPKSEPPDHRVDLARLRDRLGGLGLAMVEVAGDGNCQFRAVSLELYGTERHHAYVRAKAIDFICLPQSRAYFAGFLGEDLASYVAEMSKPCVWGDELTLRAICNAFGILMNVITSELSNWALRYVPEDGARVQREAFLTYIAPVHYNALTRTRSTQRPKLEVAPSFQFPSQK